MRDSSGNPEPPRPTVVVSELGDELDLVCAAMLQRRLDDALALHLLAADDGDPPPFVIDLSGVHLLSAAGIAAIDSFVRRARSHGVVPRLAMIEGTPPHRALKALGLLDLEVHQARPRRYAGARRLGTATGGGAGC
jgi:anti-anti-sigma regulatory factor